MQRRWTYMKDMEYEQSRLRYEAIHIKLRLRLSLIRFSLGQSRPQTILDNVRYRSHLPSLVMLNLGYESGLLKTKDWLVLSIPPPTQSPAQLTTTTLCARTQNGCGQVKITVAVVDKTVAASKANLSQASQRSHSPFSEPPNVPLSRGDRISRSMLILP